VVVLLVVLDPLLVLVGSGMAAVRSPVHRRREGSALAMIQPVPIADVRARYAVSLLRSPLLILTQH
jgi:uncharacterized membrane protein